MLCYFFPPIGGGGTQRTTKFVKYLSQFGYHPTVFSGASDSHGENREFKLDASQATDLNSADYDIVRVGNPNASGWRSSIRKSRWFPYAWAAAYPWLYEACRPWAYRAAQLLVEAHRSKPFDLIYVSAAPNSALETGAWASRRLGVPWVADLRDLWTRDTLKFYPTRWHYRWESRLERRVLRTASAVIGNTPLSTRRLREWLGQEDLQPKLTIPNGFDPDDFTQQPSYTSPRPDDTITVVYAGTLHDPEFARSRCGRYRPHDLDHSARSVESIVSAMLALRDASPDIAARFRFRLLGFVPPKSHRRIQEAGLQAQICCEGVLPHAEALSAVKAADCLLAVQVAFADHVRPVPYVPGKVYDYLATGKPILAPVPRGDLHELLAQAPQAYVSDYWDSQQVAESMKKLAEDINAGAVQKCDSEWLSRYSRVELTRQLADVFDRILGGEEGAVYHSESEGHEMAQSSA